MKTFYYFDLIKINTEVAVDELLETVNLDTLRQYCDSVFVYETGELLMMKNLYSCIEIHQATDKAISYLQSLCLGRTTMSRIEVTRDIQCASREEALAMAKDFQENNLMRFSTGNMRYGNTLYMGKEVNEFSSIYNVSYVPIKTKLGRINVFHDEFVINYNSNIKRILGINSLYDLRTVEEHYIELYKKYIIKAKPNNARLDIHFPNRKVDTIDKIVSVASEKKNKLRYLEQKNTMLNIICDKRMKERFGIKDAIEYTDKEKLVLNQSMGYWVKKIK